MILSPPFSPLSVLGLWLLPNISPIHPLLPIGTITILIQATIISFPDYCQPGGGDSPQGVRQLRRATSAPSPLPPPQPKHIPGQILLPQELLLPGEHLRLGRGQEAVTWGEGDRPRGRVPEWSRASQARPDLYLASTRAGMGSPGALMDTGSVPVWRLGCPAQL